MQTIFSLKEILNTIANKDGNRRLILNSAPVGGIGSRAMYLLIASLSFIEYGILFNDYVFNRLGIATVIIAYIVFLSTSMMVVFGMVWFNNRRLIKKINTSWAYYFPNVDINLVMASGYSPYREFFSHYSEAIKKKIPDDELHNFITKSIALMEEENRDLLDVMGTPKR